MTRGRHHNQACVVTEASGDEHQRREPPTAVEVLAGAMRKTSNEKSATETLRDEHGHSSRSNQQAILDGIRQAHAHSLKQTVRRETHLQTNLYLGQSPDPTVSRGGPEL
jgi:hypothetical protein